jgi:hypothetical protein
MITLTMYGIPTKISDAMALPQFSIDYLGSSWQLLQK